MCFPCADRTQIDRVQRLIFYLTEFMKPPGGRTPEMQRILPPYPNRDGHLTYPRFNMNMVYCGKQDASGGWCISCVHPVGLAALDPWFKELRPSFITNPKDRDTLDVGGVSILNRNGVTWLRLPIIRLDEYFGFGPVDWKDLIDSSRYFDEFAAIGGTVRPWMVLKRLYRLTRLSHGTADPSLPEESGEIPEPLSVPDIRSVPAL